jgi:hypothetical protein
MCSKNQGQLQIVIKEAPSQNAQNKFIIDKLLPEKKKIKARIHIRVEWKDPTGKYKKEGD